MSRRGSACAIALMLTGTLVNGSPMVYSNTCKNDDALFKALQLNSDSAVPFCKDYVPQPPAPTVTPEVVTTSTVLVSNSTITETVTKTATLTFTVAEDRLVRVTSSQECPNGTPTPQAAPQAAPAAPGPPRRGGRHASLPDYVATYQPGQISSACNCLVTATAQATMSTVTVTSIVPIVTKYYTKYNDSPILSYKKIVATRTAVSISCITSPPDVQPVPVVDPGAQPIPIAT